MFFRSLAVFTLAVVLAHGSYSGLMADYQKHLGPNGSYLNGEIEILTDQVAIAEAEAEMKTRLLKQHSEQEAEAWSRTGVVAEDQYWIWIRDPVIFPSGHKGTYDRIVWRNALKGPQGVAIVPIFVQDGRIGVNLNYRHATRSWEIEIPRGKCLSGESFEEGAIRECREETGFEVDNLKLLGSVAPDSGLTSTVVPVFRAQVKKSKLGTPEHSEAIHKIIILSREEILDGFVKGFIQVKINGASVKAACRDPFLSYALFLMLAV